MERKIGEIFEHNGEWYQCVKGMFCNFCAFDSLSCTMVHAKGRCSAETRNDETDVIFKKLKKVGDPYRSYCPLTSRSVLLQSYRTYETPIVNDGSIVYNAKKGLSIIDIEVKQNKEDMEENITKLSNSCKIGKNLRPFNLEEAKAGKPVCTRDGRKARIICFDKKAGRPMVALVPYYNGDSEDEYIMCYDIDGYRNCKEMHDDCDLMMAPEIHEGWVNVYQGGKLDADYIYPTKEEALENVFQPMKDKYIDTVKVEWEE